MSRAIPLGLMLLVLVKGDYPVTRYSEYEEVAIIDDEVPSRNNERYRLPISVEPLEYDIYIDLFFAERNDRPFSYDGKEYIIIQAVEENVSQIVLHANVDSVNAVSLLTSSGSPVIMDPTKPFTIEPHYHFLKINLQQTLTARTNYTLIIEYTSTMNEGPMKRGIWRGWYLDENGNERIYAATHFQPYNARQAFPCWDEPLFKSVFRLHISRPESYSGTYSNTRIETRDKLGIRVRDNFFGTPKMSSYLVTFLVSESFVVIAEDTSYDPPIRIIGRSNTVGLGDHALELAVQMTKYFDEYFGIPYSDLHPFLNNDHIASPDWASAGTENWGMVSYRELHMILDPRETIMSAEHYAATLVSHELAHKWFGNLITCYWWSNTWINEGFASYFGYLPTYQVFPQYEHHEHFNSRYLQTSLSFDSGVSTVPMNHQVNTPQQVTGHFGTISYSKGAAFLRMTADMITPETFRKACQYFLRKNAYQATDQFDLYNALAQAIAEDETLSEYQNFKFTEYYDVWVNKPGYPLLTVNINHVTGEMSLSQERFFISAALPSTQVYPIPISYSTNRTRYFNHLKPIYMMTSQRAVLQKEPGEEWVIVNNLQHGHYRVTYDEKSWNLIGEALLNDPESIHHLNRAQVVDDVFALMRSGKMTYNFGFKMLRFLRKEVNYHVWNPAIRGFSWLRDMMRHIPTSQAILDNFILNNMEHVIETLGFDVTDNESPTISLTRQEVLHFACTLGHDNCVQESRERFLALKNNDIWVDPRIRRNVYVSGIREGDQSDYQFLLNRMSRSNFANDQLEMLRALGAVKSPELITQYLQLTLTKAVRSHDKATSFNYVLQGNPENARTVLEFVKNNIDKIRVEYVEDAPPRPVHTCLSNLASYLSESGLVEYENWLRNTQSNSLQYNTAMAAITTARNNMAWGAANAEAILAAAKLAQRGGAVNVVVSTALLVVMTLVAMFV
ncbi:membrane alanyl aminopeptidase-like [Battus philenor]|uniref:membrane alanyl aminopeptidase-like n=1 Tax=Battus philenor TaxID=42288 RepID=UPI0035CEFB38